MRKRRKKVSVLFIILAVIMLISFGLTTYVVIDMNILPLKYLLIYIGLFLIIPLGIMVLTIFKRRLRKVWKIIAIIYDIIYILIMLVVFFYLSQTSDFLNKFTTTHGYETKNYYVIVNSDSKYEKIKDLKNKKVGYSKGLDSSADNALKELQKKITINHEEYNGFSELLTELDSNNIAALLIVDTFYDMLTENDETLKDKIRIIYQFSVQEKAKEIAKDVNVTKETFNVYVSGIDSYGSVTDQTRSDVNIVMNINPKTNKILMINIPRDYYVLLNGVNQKDKLTHAGMYGIEMSTKTIENLLDIEINYYVKVNYNALIDLVDILDGVDVYSAHKFKSGEGYRFDVGYNHVSGKEALEFVRTRKAFLDGDRVRGENQQAMIQAIIKKACSADILLKYDNILDSLEDSFTTNLSTDNIMSLVNMQLDKMPSWTINSISLNGSDSHNLTYTYPTQELYVMEPNEETILEAKMALEQNK